MGKFINTTYQNAVDSITNMNKDLISNPFYLFNNNKPTKVTYYNICLDKSTLDPGSELAYTNIGDKSPLRFNVIHDMYIYQFPRIEVNLENGDFGQESSSIEGESYILPNTIKPMEGDYFEVEHIKDRKWLFRINSVDLDTLDNDNNVWKINWSLDRGDNREILKNVVNNFEYIISPEGTNTKAVVELSDYQFALELDNFTSSLREYFKDLFYDEHVQTFTYKWYNESTMVDPFSIEFIQRNDLLSDSENQYWYVKQQVVLPKTFAIDYNRSIFMAFEKHDKDCIMNYQYQSQADYIDDAISIFATRYEPYFALNYKTYYFDTNTPTTPKGIIPVLSEDFILHIATGELYTKEDDEKKLYLNTIIKWFKNDKITKEDICHIKCIDLNTTEEIYYHLLFLIFVLDQYTKQLLSKENYYSDAQDYNNYTQKCPCKNVDEKK